MECLPEEVALMIAKHLTDRELAACCATSHAWRDLFDRDVFWKRRCDADLVTYLRDAPCVVEPGFIGPEVGDSGLSKVGEWRLSYMRQNHLQNNIRQGYYHTFELPTKTDFHNQRQNKCCVFYGNDFVITNSVSRHEISQGFSLLQLWDLKKKPVPLSELRIPLFFPDFKINSSQKLQVHNNLLVVWEVDLVYVLTITPTPHKLEFKHSFCFHHTIKTKHKIRAFPPGPFDRVERTQTTLIGSILLGHFNSDTDQNTLHVWNIETGDKITEQTCGNSKFVSIFGSDSSQNNETPLVVKQSDSRYKLLIYNVSQMKFTPFRIYFSSVPQDCKIHNKCLAVHLFRTIIFYNIDDNSLITFAAILDFSKITAFKKSIVFVQQQGVTAFNTCNRKLIISNSSYFQIAVYCDMYILVGSVNNLNDKNTDLLISTKKKKELRTFPFEITNVQCSNRFFSKLLLYTDGHMKKVISYW